MVNRRRFVGDGLRLGAGLALGRAGVGWAGQDLQGQGAGRGTINLRVGSGARVGLAANFVGLGYEMLSVATPGLLSAKNATYVELVRGLGAAGVIRAGGIVADYSRYEANGTAVAEKQHTVVTRASLEEFGGFLRRTGWRAIWSVNFAAGSVAEAVEEARAVRAALGDRLLALELGNEVENYGRGERPFRKGVWDYDVYRKEFEAWRAEILKAVPGVGFAAPDTASSVEWVERMAKDAKGEVQLLTTHYYRNNQSRGSVEQLLEADPRLKDVLGRMRVAAEASGIPWRMCETNSFSGGGRPGVSDTFVGALWTLDFMCLLAANGCSGVNIETGVNQLGFVSSYSPVQDDGKGRNWAGVPYYGMLAFAAARAGCDAMLPVEFDAAGVDVTAYAMGAAGRVRAVVVVNRDRERDAEVSVAGLGLGSVMRLSAAAADSKSGVTLGGGAVDEQGRWVVKDKERVKDGRVMVGRMSGVVVRA